jgi:hypothetical protein
VELDADTVIAEVDGNTVNQPIVHKDSGPSWPRSGEAQFGEIDASSRLI